MAKRKIRILSGKMEVAEGDIRKIYRTWQQPDEQICLSVAPHLREQGHVKTFSFSKEPIRFESIT
jgi:hypothetical protein